MKSKVREKARAIALRRKGYSYNEIIKQVPIAKSTLSAWVKDLPLTPSEKRTLKQRRDKNITRGRIKAAAANRENRLQREKELFVEAQKEFSIFTRDELFKIGLALYWAEGAKRTDRFGFMNSDTDMINLMLDWVEKFYNVPRREIKVRLYIHKPYANEHCEEFWAKHTNIPIENFLKTIYKPTASLVKKRPQYKGCLRIEVPQTARLKKMKFWIQMFIESQHK